MFSKQSLKIHFLPSPTSSSSSVLSGLSTSRPYHDVALQAVEKKDDSVRGHWVNTKELPLESVMVSPPMSPADPNTPLEQRTSRLFYPPSTDQKGMGMQGSEPKTPSLNANDLRLVC